MKSQVCSLLSLAILTLVTANPNDSTVRTVWDTSKPMNVDFCPHVSTHDTSHFQNFFSDILNKAHGLTTSLERLDLVDNIIIIQPDHIRCVPHTIYIAIETHHVTEELKYRLKEFALALNDETNISISLILKIQPVDRPFPLWEPRKGLYVLCKERDRHTRTPSQEDWEIILHLARRRRLEVLKASKIHDDLIQISVGSFGSTTNLQHFERELRQRLRKSVRIVLGA